jgi:hypothetical protein
MIPVTPKGCGNTKALAGCSAQPTCRGRAADQDAAAFAGGHGSHFAIGEVRYFEEI